MLKISGKPKRSETPSSQTAPSSSPARMARAADAERSLAAANGVNVSSVDVSRVDVSIEYCEPGNCLGPARCLVRSIQRELGVNSTLIPSRGGVFEVRVQGRLVFSKRATRRLPSDEEIFYHVRAALAAKPR